MAAKKLSEITPGIPAPTDRVVGVTAGGQDRLFNVSAVGGNSFPPMFDSGIVYVPGLSTSSFAYTIPNGVWHVVFNGTMTLQSGTITMPAIPIDGQVVRLKTMQQIEGVAFLANAGQSLVGSPSTMAPNTYVEATYDLANTTWYCEFISNALITLTAPLTLYVCLLAGTIVGGSAYTAGTYTGVSLTGGSGTGAVATIVVAGGAVTVVQPTTQGTGYLVGDVLSAPAASIGGTGSGFTFTLTGIGNDLQTGTTQASAFRTLTRANQELGFFNWAQGVQGTVNVYHGFYDEQLVLNNLVGTSEDQIAWVGDSTNRNFTHVRPSTNPNSLAVVTFDNVVGHHFEGFWFDGQNAGFNGWDVLRLNGNSIAKVRNCRLSLLANDSFELIIVNGGTLNMGAQLGIDLPGTQGSFATMGQNTQLIFTSDSVITQLGAATTIPPGNFFFEIARGAFVYLNFDPFASWVGWGGTTGIQASIQAGAKILTLEGFSASIPGNADSIQYTSNLSTYGPVFDDQVSFDPGILAFGCWENNFITPFGDDSNLPGSNTWAVWSYNNSGSVAGDVNHFLLVNNKSHAGAGLVRGLELFRHITASSYTALLSDLNRRVEMDNAGANTFTIPTDLTFQNGLSGVTGIPVGGEITVVQAGAGSTTIAAAVGVTARAFGAIGGQWKAVKLYKRAANEWVMTTV